MARLALLVEELTIKPGPAWTEATDMRKAPLVWRMTFQDVPKRGPRVQILWAIEPMKGWGIEVEIGPPQVSQSPPILGWSLYAPGGELMLAMPGWNGLHDAFGLAHELQQRQQRIEDATS